MSSDFIDENLKRFILDRFESVAQVEVLCIFINDENLRWTPETLSQELRSSTVAVTHQISSLLKIGLIKKDGVEYKYAPQNSSLDDLAKGLVKAYSERRVSVINLIYEKPTERIKTFADAFKIKREE